MTELWALETTEIRGIAALARQALLACRAFDHYADTQMIRLNSARIEP